MINTVILMGRLTNDPELRQTTSGTSVARFNLAVDRTYNKGETDFIPIVVWRQTAEFVSKYFRKGSMIAVRGELHQTKFKDKDGNNRSSFEVVSDMVSFCGEKKEEQNDVTVKIADEDGFPF